MYCGLYLVAFLGFCLSRASAEYDEPHCGGRQVIVHLFEWRWADVAAECERYLGPKGFCGVQVSPPNENAVVDSNPRRPWWERYQPVSYKLTTRSGNETDFKDMVDRCKAVGVRIYVDAVINHMAGSDRSGHGTAGTRFNGGRGDFPGVPFTSGHFHSASDCGARGDINYQVPNQVRNCDLVGLRDLDHSQTHVLDKVADYLNTLIDLGVAGFRVDAAKHMWPSELSALQSKLKDLPEGGRPFFYHEVIDFNTEPIKADQYFDLGRVTEFRYQHKVKDGVHSFGRLRYVYDAGWGMAPSSHALVFVDNHDTQREAGTLNYKRGDEYKRAVAFTLANDYGFVKVMSSFSFRSRDDGPPHESDYSTKRVTINADGSCGNGWVCEHRWNMVGNLARFRTAVHGHPVTNWLYSNQVLTFSRGDKGFFAMGYGHFDVRRNTCLPAGQYCDLVSDCATTVTVDPSGQANISPADPSEPFVAIITEEKADDGGNTIDDTDDVIMSGVATKDGDGQNEPPQSDPTVTAPTVTLPADDPILDAVKGSKLKLQGADNPIQSDPSSKPIQTGPSNPIQSDPSNPIQPDPSNPIQSDPSNPIQSDPSNTIHPNPFNPIQSDPSALTRPDPSNPIQQDPSNPIQSDPSNPIQPDPSNATQPDPSNPIQSDPFHPIQSDSFHSIQSDPFHPIQLDPSSPIQSDPLNATRSNPLTPKQLDSSSSNRSDPLNSTVRDPANSTDVFTPHGEDFQRTVIVIEKETKIGQDVFIRGGLDSSQVSGCTQDARTSPCSIPIRHVQNYTSDHYSGLISWSQGDLFLDWVGAEPGQGTFRGKKASGTPAFWSTEDASRQGYSQLNKWGDHHWIVDIEMDCGRTQNGYFQVRAMVNGLMERRQRQAVGPCVGDGAPVASPFPSQYHIARCGYLNVFSFGKSQCEIEKLAQGT